MLIRFEEGKGNERLRLGNFWSDGTLTGGRQLSSEGSKAAHLPAQQRMKAHALGAPDADKDGKRRIVSIAGQGHGVPGRPDEDRDAAGQYNVCEAPAAGSSTWRQQTKGAPLHVHLQLLVGHLHTPKLCSGPGSSPPGHIVAGRHRESQLL